MNAYHLHLIVLMNYTDIYLIRVTSNWISDIAYEGIIN